MSLSRVIELSQQSPLGQGTSRAIYQHPQFRDYLVKVFFGDDASPWYRFNRRRYGRCGAFIKEMREQLYAWKQYGRHPEFLQKMIGLCETDLGPGMIVEKVVENDGRLGRNLLQIIQQGDFDNHKRTMLGQLFDELAQSPIYFDDLKPRNLVWGATSGNRQRFILVDGIGNKVAVPIKHLLPRLHARQKQAQIESCRAKIRRVLGETLVEA